ncbi:MAG: gamma-glutamylcyclotransferase family protein [Candidatus Brocadiales bacterium]
MKYFAYGSNMDAKRMEERNINFTQRMRAFLKGFELRFNKMSSNDPENEGYANVVPDEKGIVEGVLYDILDSDLPKLDIREGYPEHYDRVNLKIESHNYKEQEAVIYIAQPDKVKEGLRPTKDYLNHLLAAKDILSESYYRRLECWETLNY